MTSIRYASLALALALAGSTMGPGSAGGPGVRLALDDSNPRHCTTALDGSQFCNDDAPGPGSIGGPNPNSPYNECKVGCGEHALTLAASKRDAYLQKCLAQCHARYGQRTRGG
jgi:hypothetical protein